jgi:thymidine phosphorylase
VLHAPRAGVVAHVDAGALGRAATFLGVGRLRKEDPISPGAAIILQAKAGTRVERGDPLCTLHYDDPARARAARPLVEGAFRIGSSAVRARPLVLETLG